MNIRDSVPMDHGAHQKERVMDCWNTEYLASDGNLVPMTFYVSMDYQQQLATAGGHVESMM